MKEKSEWDIQWELVDRTMEALLLGFSELLYFDYPLPNPYEIRTFTERAVRELCGSLDTEHYWNGNPNIRLSRVKDQGRLEPRVLKGLVGAINAPREQNSRFDDYMSLNNKFGSEWFYNLGSLYRFRQGEREKAEQGVRSYWNETELGNFEELNKIIQRCTREEYRKKKGR